MPPPPSSTPSSRWICVAPVAVSYVSNEAERSQGTPDPLVLVRLITARTAVRRPVEPTFVKGKVMAEICPLVKVKEVAVPIRVPAVLKNEMLPVQDAAVPDDAAVAVLTTLTEAVSELPKPAGGKLAVRVVVVPVVVVCAKALAAVSAANANDSDNDRFKSMLNFLFSGR